MNDQEIIIAIAELDGWKYIDAGLDSFGVPYHPIVNRGNETILVSRLPAYLTSRDAIIPVIEKQNTTRELRFKFFETLCEEFYGSKDEHNSWRDVQIMAAMFSSPRQLCIALLKATGKWKSE